MCSFNPETTAREVRENQFSPGSYTWVSIACARNQRANQKPSRPASYAMTIRSTACPAFAASSRQRWMRRSSPASSGSSFFSGWRSTPGTVPATNQLDKLSCLVAEHCWDPVGLAIADYAYWFQRLLAAPGQR